MNVFLFFLFIIGITLVLGFVFKKVLLRYFCQYIKKKTGFSLHISTLGLSFNGIVLKQLSIDRAAVHLEVDRLNLGLTFGQPILSLQIEHLKAYYRPAVSKNTTATNNTEQHNSSSLQKVVTQITRLWQRKHPQLQKHTRIKIHHFQAFYLNDTEPLLAIAQLALEKQQITFELNHFGSLQSKYAVVVRFDQHRILYALHNLSTAAADPLQIDHLKGKIDLTSPRLLILSAYGTVLRLNHPKIAQQTLHLSKLNCLFKFNWFQDRLELDPDSIFQVNDICLEMKGHFNYQESLCAIVLYVNVVVEQLIALIPNLQNKDLKDFKSNGQIGIGLSLGFLWDDPLHYKFDLAYDTDDFNIINPGIDLSYLLKDFSFKSLINPENHRWLTVNSSNDHAQLLLTQVIQLAEDPNFYQHNGVDSYFVGVAMANNLAKKQFFKGASTLSMQLIKNLLLGEEKSLARKLEELILTLLMENHFHIPKERILAIYLQLIELGPDVYGIEEAAKFYFNKPVSALTPLECLVISYIIPRPRFFLAAVLIKSNQLDRNLSKHITNKLSMLVAKQVLTAAELLVMPNSIKFYQHGEFELKHLNLSNLTQSLTRQETYLKKANENSRS